MRLINLTPHTINLVLGPVSLTLPSEGEARVSTVSQPRPPLCVQAWGDLEVTTERLQVPTERLQYTHVVGLPGPMDGVRYVVSLVAVDGARRAGRTLHDLFSPGRLIRDEAGRVTGCASLVRHA